MVKLKIPLTVNAVMHRANIANVGAMVDLALSLGASRVEIAHVQYYGWALKNRAMAILDDRGEALAAEWNGLRPQAGLAPLPGEGRMWTDGTGAGAWRVRLQPVSFGNRRFGLLVAAPLADVDRERHEAQEAMQIGIPVALLLAVAGGLWLVLTGRFCARRLRQTSRAPRHIAEMVVTSMLIPPLSLYWRLCGAMKFRVWFL